MKTASTSGKADRAQQLVLGALAAVEQDTLAARAQQQRGQAALGRRDRPRGAGEEQRAGPSGARGRVASRHPHGRAQLRAGAAAVDALDPRHVRVVATVADLDVTVSPPSVRFVGSVATQVSPDAAGSSASIQAWVSTSADAYVVGTAPTGSRRRNRRRSRGGAAAAARRPAKSWQTPAPASSRSLTVEPTYASNVIPSRMKIASPATGRGQRVGSELLQGRHERARVRRGCPSAATSSS